MDGLVNCANTVSKLILNNCICIPYSGIVSFFLAVDIAKTASNLTGSSHITSSVNRKFLNIVLFFIKELVLELYSKFYKKLEISLVSNKISE